MFCQVELESLDPVPVGQYLMEMTTPILHPPLFLACPVKRKKQARFLRLRTFLVMPVRSSCTYGDGNGGGGRNDDGDDELGVPYRESHNHISCA